MNKAKKEKEIAEFRKYNKYYTSETIRLMKSEEELTKDAKYRRKLYDYYVNGGLKPRR